MNKFAPKAEFLRPRAISLHRSGYNIAEISRMLKVDHHAARSWITPEAGERRLLTKQIKYAERMAAIRYQCPSLPTLAFVPKIQLTPMSKYRMESAHVRS